MGKWEKCCKDFSNGYTFSDKLDTEDLPPLLKRIMQLHDDVVSRDKMIIETLNIVSGPIAMQETDEQEKNRQLKRQKPTVLLTTNTHIDMKTDRITSERHVGNETPH